MVSFDLAREREKEDNRKPNKIARRGIESPKTILFGHFFVFPFFGLLRKTKKPQPIKIWHVIPQRTKEHEVFSQKEK